MIHLWYNYVVSTLLGVRNLPLNVALRRHQRSALSGPRTSMRNKSRRFNPCNFRMKWIHRNFGFINDSHPLHLSHFGSKNYFLLLRNVSVSTVPFAGRYTARRTPNLLQSSPYLVTRRGYLAKHYMKVPPTYISWFLISPVWGFKCWNPGVRTKHSLTLT